MRWSTMSAIIRHEFRILMTDASAAVFNIVMPLGMVALMRGLFRGALQTEGFTDVNGSEFAVPGIAVSFAAFSIGYAGFAFFRDHGWNTWDRLRASPASSLDIMVGKVTPAVAVTLAQLGLLFALGGPLFGLTISGSVVALIIVIVVFALSLNAFGVTVTALSRTSQQLNVLGGAGGFVLAMLGGAFVPLSAMPGWAQTIAPAMPTYWAMRGMRSVILEGGSIGDVVLPVIVLTGFGVAFSVIAATRFRFEESKTYYG